jgi:hypothetical protein
VHGGTLTVDDSTLSGNNVFVPGGGIWSRGKTLTVRNPRDFEGEWIGYWRTLPPGLATSS